LNKSSYPICFTRGSLGPNTPNNDVFVSPNHGVLVNNKFVSAKLLVNGKSIYQDMSMNEIKYYHIELADHHVIVADNMTAESFVDSNAFVHKSSFIQNI